MKRVERLRQLLEHQELDAILVSHTENRRYLSGFTGSTGWLLISQNHAFLAADFRYIEQSKREAVDFEIVNIKGDLPIWLPKLISELRLKKVGVEADHIPFIVYDRLCNEINNGNHQFQLIPTTNLVQSLRNVKEAGELEYIIKAANLADAAFEYAASIIRSGITERELAWELESFLREKGSETLPFEIIVASGANSALPHARPSEQVICDGEPVVIDLGARVNGYCSDLSRTFCVGKGDKTFFKIYDIVLGSQLTALATIRAGMSGDQADKLSRTVIEQAGFGEAFGHGLGHGVGLQAHESPRIAPNSIDLLSDGMVFTVEPGIYVTGWGGVRIEDTVMLEDNRVKILTKANKTTT